MSNHHPLRIVFMGTPDFSVPTLEALIQAGHTIVGVYCQPDKQKGRGKQVQMPPVKVAALEHNLPVYQPVTLRDEQVQAELEALKPDVVVVIAYGKILPPWLNSIASIWVYQCTCFYFCLTIEGLRRFTMPF